MKDMYLDDLKKNFMARPYIMNLSVYNNKCLMSLYWESKLLNEKD